MNVACYESVTSHRQCHYRFRIGSPLVSSVVFRPAPDGEDSSRRGHRDVVRNASRSSELPDSAGGLADRIGGCRRRDGIQPPPPDVMTPGTSALAPVTARVRSLHTWSAGRSPASTCERPGWVSGARILQTVLMLWDHGTLRPTGSRTEVSERGASLGQHSFRWLIEIC